MGVFSVSVVGEKISCLVKEIPASFSQLNWAKFRGNHRVRIKIFKCKQYSDYDKFQPFPKFVSFKSVFRTLNDVWMTWRRLKRSFQIALIFPSWRQRTPLVSLFTFLNVSKCFQNIRSTNKDHFPSPFSMLLKKDRHTRYSIQNYMNDTLITVIVEKIHHSNREEALKTEQRLLN